MILTFYIERVLSNKLYTFTKITREIYIIDNLKVDILIKLDIIISK